EWLALQLLAQSYGDQAPTEPMRAGFAEACKALAANAARWQQVNAKDLPALAAELSKSGIKTPQPAAGVTAPKC
ncbi:MAG TPA: hypothetical protein VL980_00595, partial [Gemmatimonadaceae bacterium]|nr:hypothetical protein [Gemmatimonadaceae bacterium]